MLELKTKFFETIPNGLRRLCKVTVLTENFELEPGLILREQI
jgi:hypothetical protein